jgi:hypothetical protein
MYLGVALRADQPRLQSKGAQPTSAEAQTSCRILQGELDLKPYAALVWEYFVFRLRDVSRLMAMHRVEAVAMLSSGAGSEETYRHRANRKRSGCKMKHPEFKKFERREGQPWNSKEAWKAWRCLNEKHDAEPRRRRAETGIWHCGSGPRIHLSTHFMPFQLQGCTCVVCSRKFTS